MEQIIQTLLIAVISPSIWLAIVYKIFNLGKIFKQFETTLNDIAELKSTTSTLRDNMSAVRTFLVTNVGMQDSLFNTKSPIKLHPKGEELLENSGFKQLFVTNKEEFLQAIKKHKHNTPAEIDESSMLALYDLIETSLLERFKTKAFENGVVLELLLRVCGIYLRDEAIKELLPTNN